MTTAIDTNVFIVLWDQDASTSASAQTALDSAFLRGNLIVSAPIYCELMAGRGRTETFLDAFFRDAGIVVDFELDVAIWKLAGMAFQQYAARRKKQRHPGPRRILADFLIGAHAFHHGYQLLTFDQGFFKIAFPGLSTVAI